nr:sugar phosphate isomerase/epimerase family protein [Naumannella cuiyingiana]
MPKTPPWPLAACSLGLATVDGHGRPVADAGPDFWLAELAKVRGLGFDHLELGDIWLPIGDLDPAAVTALGQAVKEAHLDACAVHIQRRSVIDPESSADNLAYHHRAIDAAAALGVPIYSTGLHRPLTPAQQRALWFWTAPGPVDPTDPQTRALAVRRLRELADHCVELGMKLALELYEDTLLGTAEDAVRLIEDLDHDGIGLNPDVGNLIRLHRPVEDWREAYRRTLPHAVYWHAKNYQRDEAGDGSWATSMPSTLRDGLINYRDVIAMADAAGYRGPIACEHYGGDSLGVAAANREYLASLIATLPTTREDA